jgi:UPF0755 protein
MRSRAEELAEETGLPIDMDKIVIMASIIEKEVSITEERDKVSSIIYRRLGEDMPLQMCSTVLYAMDKRKDRLLLSDLEVDSPFNTYRNTGLPPGAISCPGRSSIMAALYPSNSDILYFVLKDEETGEHLFTSDYDEFVVAKERYGQMY